MTYQDAAPKSDISTSIYIHYPLDLWASLFEIGKADHNLPSPTLPQHHSIMKKSSYARGLWVCCSCVLTLDGT
jgi:hypothetical protein